MNFLGHIFFSIKDDEIILGNLMGDFVKGNIDKTDYSEKIKQGLKLHRKIDSLADESINFKNSKKRIRSELGLYSGAVVDIYYDHFLAKNWDKVHNEGLEKYSKSIYSTLKRYKSNFTENFDLMFYYMEKRNWLYNYRKIEFIDTVFERMANRNIKRDKIRFAGELLRRSYKELEKDFYLFIDEMDEKIKKVSDNL